MTSSQLIDMFSPIMRSAALRLALVSSAFVLLASPRIAAAQTVGESANQFVGETREGGSLSLNDLKGKVVILDFWASWCGPCREEMPFLIDTYLELGNDDLEILGINVDEKTKYMDSFLDELDLKPPFPILMDPKGKIAADYKLEGMPTTVFIDRKGIVQYVHSGFVSKDKKIYRDKIVELLSADS